MTKYLKRHKIIISKLSFLCILLGSALGTAAILHSVQAQQSLESSRWKIENPTIQIREKEKEEKIKKRSDKDIPSLRRMFSKTFQNSDGTYSKEMYLHPVHYKDDNNQWQTIDTTIVPSTDENYDYMNETNLFKTYFSIDPFGRRENVKYQIDDAWITFNTLEGLKAHLKEQKKDLSFKELKDDFRSKRTKSFLGFKFYLPQKDDLAHKSKDKANKLHYPKLLDEAEQRIDVDYEIFPVRLLEEVILYKQKPLESLTQQVELHNLFVKQKGATLGFYHKTTKKRLFKLARPVMYELKQRWDDTTDNPTRFENYGLNYEIKCQTDQALKNCNRLLISKVLTKEGKAWLEDKQRHYPVVIDLTADYDFSDTTDNWAYEKGGTLPSNPTDYDSQATSTDYSNLSSSDNSRWTTDLATTTGKYDSQIYTLTIDEVTSEISSIDIEWEGYGEIFGTSTTDLKVWNDDSSAWEQLDSIDFSTTTDQTATGTISTSITDYINSSSTLSMMVKTMKNTKSDGESCSAGGECDSGNCVDGYCCDTTCVGTCVACNLSGSEGTCTNAPDGDDPDGECDDSGWDGCSGSCVKTKSNDGSCNGSGSCGTDSANVTADYYCSSGSEVSGACNASWHCTGDDKCQYACNSGSCSQDYNCSTCELTCSDGSCIDCSCGGSGYETHTIGGDTVYVDCNADKCWTPTAGSEYDWSGAISYCSGLNYGGKTDWYLPSSTVLWYLCSSGSCSGSCFGGDSGGNFYCSSTQRGSEGYNMHEFGVYECVSYGHFKYETANVRCVR